MGNCFLKAIKSCEVKETQHNLWKQTAVLFSLELTGQALEPRAAVLQAPGTPEVLQKLGSAQLKARQLFPQQLRSPCTLPPTQGATRLITLAGSPGLC